MHQVILESPHAAKTWLALVLWTYEQKISLVDDEHVLFILGISESHAINSLLERKNFKKSGKEIDRISIIRK